MMTHYIALSFIYLGICAFWQYLTWTYYSGTQVDKSLQAALLAIPLLKLF